MIADEFIDKKNYFSKALFLIYANHSPKTSMSFQEFKLKMYIQSNSNKKVDFYLQNKKIFSRHFNPFERYLTMFSLVFFMPKMLMLEKASATMYNER